jgi:hypothetical protein
LVLQQFDEFSMRLGLGNDRVAIHRRKLPGWDARVDRRLLSRESVAGGLV